MKQRGIWIYCALLAAIVSLHRRRDDRGATTVEYGLIAGLCVLAFVGGIAALRLGIGNFFSGTQTRADNWVP